MDSSPARVTTPTISAPLPTAVQWSHTLLKPRLSAGQTVVDATAGNGHDTLFLAQAVADGGHVYAYDVQQQAIESTRSRLETAQIPAQCYTLLDCGHQNISETLPTHLRGNLAAVMFNLGYLPGGDKNCITLLENTLQAMQQSLEWLMEGGMLTIVVYPGHQGGDSEAIAVEQYLSALTPDQFEVQKLGFLNYRPTTPFLMVVRKRTWRK